MNNGTSGLNGAFIYNYGTVQADANFQIGTYNWAVFSQNSGTFNVNDYLSIARYGGSGALSVNGGVVNAWNRQIIVGESGDGALNIYGGGVYAPHGVALSGSGGSKGSLDLGGGQLVTAQIWKGSGTGNLTLNGGTLKATRDEWNFISGLSSANIGGAGAVIDNNGKGIAINQTLTGSGSGSVKFDGSNKATLRQNNTYTGDTLVRGGILQFYESGSLYNNGTAAGNIYVNSGTTLYFNRNNTFGNADTGSTSPVSITVNGGLISNGNSGVSGGGAFNNLANLTLNGGELRANGGQDSSWNAYLLNNVTVGGSSASSITANTSLNGHNAILLSRAGTTTFNVGSTGDATGDLKVSARLTDGNGITGSLTKTGTGKMVLSGSNSYSGLTTVSGGTLALNGSIAGALKVDAGATLGGSGTIGGNAVISGTHGPGNSPGLQSFGSSLSYKSTSTVLLEFTQNSTTGRGTSFDGIDVAGDLSFDPGAVMSLSFNGAGSSVNWNDQLWNNYVKTSEGWLLYSVGGSITGLNNLTISGSFLDSYGLALSSARPNSYFNLYQSGNNVYLNYAIPEPSTYALMGLGVLTLVVAYRRKRAA
jgi:autotransporter-associated beta strand protein